MGIFLTESTVPEIEADPLCRLDICLSEITINQVLSDMYINRCLNLEIESLNEGFTDVIKNIWKNFKAFCQKIFDKIKKFFSSIKKKIHDLIHKKKSTKQEKDDTSKKIKDAEKAANGNKQSSGKKSSSSTQNVHRSSSSEYFCPSEVERKGREEIKKEKEKMEDTMKRIDGKSRLQLPQKKAKCYKLDTLRLGITLITPNPFSMRSEKKRGMLNNKSITKLEDALKEILDAEKQVESYGFDSFKKSKDNLKNPLWIIQNTAKSLEDYEDDIMEDLEYTKSQEFIDNALYNLVENIPAEVFRKASPIRDIDNITAESIVKNLKDMIEVVEDPTEDDMKAYEKEKSLVEKNINTGRERLDKFLSNMESFEKEADDKQKNILSMVDKLSSVKITSFGGETDQSKIQKAFSEVINKLKKYVALTAQETIAEYTAIVKGYAIIGTSFNKIEQYLISNRII